MSGEARPKGADMATGVFKIGGGLTIKEGSLANGDDITIFSSGGIEGFDLESGDGAVIKTADGTWIGEIYDTDIFKSEIYVELT
jgi:hypothetical protein